MKNLNGELIAFLQAVTEEEDLMEISHQLLAKNYRSIKLMENTQPRRNFYNTDFLFNNQQYKVVVTRKLPLFHNSEDEMDEELKEYEE
jgi:hypothetical protein